jgi:D-3-phosphoglycerate dehydrogenase
MVRILIAGKINPSGIDLLKAAPGVSVDYVGDGAPDAYVSHLADADGLLLRTQPMTAEIIAGAPKLKIVSRHGVGFDAVDVDALNRRSIPLAIVGDVNSTTVSEHAMMLMMSCAKQLVRHHAAVQTGDWALRDQMVAIELSGKTLLVVGFGRIGRKVGALAAAFGMNIQAYDPYQDADTIAAAGATPVESLATGLAAADFVTLHIPKVGAEPIIGAAEMALMKSTAIIVSTARGGLIDETALAQALNGNRLGGAGLDVLSTEPPPPDHPLLTTNRVILTPHIGGLTAEGGERLASGAARNILDFFAGRLDPALVVNSKHINFTS